MIRSFACIFFLLLLSSCGSGTNVVLKDTHGKQYVLSSAAHKTVFINYWASWCKPCYKEIPALNAFYSKHKDQGIIVLGVNYDQVDTNKLPSLIKKMKIKFPILNNDPGNDLHLGDVPGLPVTYVLEANGKLKTTLFGPQTEKSLEASLG